MWPQALTGEGSNSRLLRGAWAVCLPLSPLKCQLGRWEVPSQGAHIQLVDVSDHSVWLALLLLLPTQHLGDEISTPACSRAGGLNEGRADQMPAPLCPGESAVLLAGAEMAGTVVSADLHPVGGRDAHSEARLDLSTVLPEPAVTGSVCPICPGKSPRGT